VGAFTLPPRCQGRAMSATVSHPHALVRQRCHPDNSAYVRILHAAQTDHAWLLECIHVWSPGHGSVIDVRGVFLQGACVRSPCTPAILTVPVSPRQTGRHTDQQAFKLYAHRCRGSASHHYTRLSPLARVRVGSLVQPPPRHSSPPAAGPAAPLCRRVLLSHEQVQTSGGPRAWKKGLPALPGWV
jgi:hypothetical protein